MVVRRGGCICGACNSGRVPQAAAAAAGRDGDHGYMAPGGGRFVSCGKVPGENAPQFFHEHRLGEVVVATGGKAFLAVAHHGMGGQGHDGAAPPLLAKPAGGLVAIHFRHLDVHQNQIVGPALGLRLFRHFTGRAAILYHVHFQIQLLQAGRPAGPGSPHRPPRTAPAPARAVPAFRAGVFPDLGPCARGGRWRFQQGHAPQRAGIDRQGESASPAQLAGDFNFAAERLGQAAGDGQPEARAAVTVRRGTIHLHEGLEEIVELVGGNADARVRNRKPYSPAAVGIAEAAHGHADPALLVNLTALPTRFTSTWRSRAASVWIVSGSGNW